MDCIFCRIANREIPATIIFEDSQVVVFDDLHGQAPHHKLIIPKRHVSTLNDLSEKDEGLMGHIVLTGAELAKTLGIDGPGYRLVLNCNADGGQSVFHVHAHLLGGREMHWPPG